MATVGVTLRGVGVWRHRHRHPGTGGALRIQRRSIAAEGSDRRPFRQCRNRRGRVRGKLGGGMHDAPSNDREDRLQPFDLFVRHGEVIVRERHQIGELPDGERAPGPR